MSVLARESITIVNVDDGEGVLITSKSAKYNTSDDGSTPPISGWSDTIPEYEKGCYLWTWVVVVYSDGTESEFYSVSYVGVDGQDGAPGEKGDLGKSIVFRGEFSSSEIYYNTDYRTDIVKYTTDGLYYTYIGTSGVSGVWNSNNWEYFGANYESIATGLLFAGNAVIEILQGTTFYVKDSSGNVVGSLQGSDYPLWLGGDSADNSTFKVGMNGAMTATEANVSGTISTKVLNLELLNVDNYSYENNNSTIINSDEVSFLYMSWGGTTYTLTAPSIIGKTIKAYWLHGVSKLVSDPLYITGGFRDLTVSSATAADTVYYTLDLINVYSGYVELISISTTQSPKWALIYKSPAVSVE